MNGETCLRELISVTKLYQAARRIDPEVIGHQGMSVNPVTSLLLRLVVLHAGGYIKQKVWVKVKYAYETSVHKSLEQVCSK